MCFLSFCAAVFCDYYNQKGKCEWHYKACGADCMNPLKTCMNPSGNCSSDLIKVEGKYIQDNHRHYIMLSNLLLINYHNAIC